MRDEAYGYGETGIGYWQSGIQALRAEGENRPSRPSNVVVEKQRSAGFLDRNSADARGIGFEWEKSPSLRSTVIPVVMNEREEDKTVFVFQGGGTTSGGGNGGLLTEDVCYTLNGMDRHAIWECNGVRLPQYSDNRRSFDDDIERQD